MLASRRNTLILVASVTMTVAVFLVMSSLLFGFRNEFISKTVNATAHVRISADELEKFEQPARLSSFVEAEIKQIEHIKPSQQYNKIRNSALIIKELEGTSGVEGISPTLAANVLIKYGSIIYPASVYGIVPDSEDQLTDLYSKAIEGKVQDLKTQDKGIVIGKIIAAKLGLGIGNTVKLVARNGSSFDFRVVAIVQTGITSQDESKLWTRLKDAQVLANQYNEITDIGIKLADYEEAEAYAASFAKKFGYKTESWQVANSNILSLLVIIFANIYFVIGGLLLAAAFGIYNVFSMSVIDRRRDLAIMQALGLTNATISQGFFFQGLVVGVIGGIMGLLIGQILIEIFSQLTFGQSGSGLTNARGFVMLKVWWLYAASFLIGVLLAVMSAILPAYRAGTVDPVEVIREG